MLCDMRTLPFAPNSVDKIVCIQALEHLAPVDVRRALNHWWNVLKPGGVLIVSVPDSEATLQLLQTDLEFGVRHLRGSLKNDYAGHLTWLSCQTIGELLLEFGFTCEFLENIHFYPAVVARAVKVDTYISDRSYQVLPGLEGCQKILDVGPGAFPLKQATHWLDLTDRREEFADRGYEGGFVCDLNERKPLWQENEWDYIYFSHVFEHLEDPLNVYEWAVWSGKRGYIEVPSAMLDYMMQHGRTHGKWLTVGSGRAMVMVSMNARQRRAFRDRGMGALFHRLTQYSIPLSQPEAVVHRNFWAAQDVLNVSISWNETHVPALVVIDEAGVRQWPS